MISEQFHNAMLNQNMPPQAWFLDRPGRIECALAHYGEHVLGANGEPISEVVVLPGGETIRSFLMRRTDEIAVRLEKPKRNVLEAPTVNPIGWFVDLYCWWVPRYARWQALRRVRAACKAVGMTDGQIAARLEAFDRELSKQK